MLTRISRTLGTGAIALGMIAGSFAFAEERQPHMQAALEHLQKARAELQAAEHDKGGHREKALTLTDQAIKHVQEGMAYDRSHEGKKDHDHDHDKH
jgi:acyl-CoA reductase-like NAD-dependent aldehyde dehydrogenase